MIFILLELSFRYLVSYIKRSLATLIILSASILSLCLFEGFFKKISLLNEQVFTQRLMLGSVMIEPVLLDDEISSADIQWLKETLSSDPKVQVLSEFIKFEASLLYDNNNFIIQGYGIDSDTADIIRGPEWKNNVIAGNNLEPSDTSTALVSSGLASHLGCSVESIPTVIQGKSAGYGDQFFSLPCDQVDFSIQGQSLSGQISGLNLTLKGLFDAAFVEPNQRTIYVPLSAAREFLNTQGSSYLIVKLKDSPTSQSIQNWVSELKNEMGDRKLNVKSWLDTNYGDLYNRTDNFLFVFRYFILAILSILVVISIFINFSKVIQERRSVLNTLQLVGYTKKQLVLLVFFECVYLSLFSGFIGLNLYGLLSKVINGLQISYSGGLISQPIPLWIDFDVVIWAFTAMTIAIVAGLTTLVTASKKI